MKRRLYIIIMTIMVLALSQAVYAEDSEVTEVTVVDSAEELVREAGAAEGDAFITIDIGGKPENLATEELNAEVEDIISGDGKESGKRDSVAALLEDSGYYEAQPSGRDKVEAKALYANRRIRLNAGYSDTLQTYGAETAAFYKDHYLLTYASEEDTKNAYEALTKDYGSDNVILDIPLKLSAEGWGTEYMGMDIMCEKVAGGTPVTVAVIDSGINRDHQIFEGVDVLGGHDYVDGDDDPDDDVFHGTATAGIIAESCGSSVSILPVKIAGASDEISPLNLIYGIEYAIENGADVINLSLGGSLPEREYSTLAGLMEDALSGSDTVVVCSSGNEGMDMDEEGTCMFPAELDSVICVGAFRQDGDICGFSNYGNALDFAAPGKGISVAGNTDNISYQTQNGTSFSAPYISAAAALILLDDPSLSQEGVQERLIDISTDLGDPGWDRFFGHGCPIFTADDPAGTDDPSGDEPMPENPPSDDPNDPDTPPVEDPDTPTGPDIQQENQDPDTPQTGDDDPDLPPEAAEEPPAASDEPSEPPTAENPSSENHPSDDPDDTQTPSDEPADIPQDLPSESPNDPVSLPDTPENETAMQPAAPEESLDIKDAVIEGVEDKTYTGSSVEQNIIVRVDGKILLKGTDYTVSYRDNKSAGAAAVIIKGKGRYTGSLDKEFRILPKKAAPTLVLSHTQYDYDGTKKTPSATVMDGDHVIPSTDYDLTYPAGCTDAGTYTVTAVLKGNYAGRGEAAFTIREASGDMVMILSKDTYVYDGTEKTPDVRITRKGAVLDSTEYTLTYPDGRTDAGTYTVKAELKGNYTGTLEKNFVITPKDVSPSVILAEKEYTYDGSVKEPEVTVKDGKQALDSSCFDVSYAPGRKDAGTYKVSVVLKGNYRGASDASFEILPRHIEPEVTLSRNSYKYTGKAKRPSVKVSYAGKALSGFETIYPDGRKNVGTYTVRVNLSGNYSGTGSATFVVRKAVNSLKVKAKTAKIKSSTLRKKSITLKRSRVMTKKGGNGKITYTKLQGNSKIKVYKKSGKIRIRKGLEKGTYKIRINVAASGGKNHERETKVIICKIKVK